jgi:hypothetical protein
MDVDLVYTYVNAEDEGLAALRNQYAQNETGKQMEWRTGSARFRDLNELKYSIKTAEKFLPFLRQIYVVHAGCAPSWLRSMNWIDLVHQEEILPAGLCPTFQSDVVEAYLHNIPGLAEHYIYANDDFFFSQPHKQSDFFTSSGQTRVAVSERIATMSLATGTYLDMELNSVRGLQRRLRLLPREAIDGHHENFRALMKIRLRAIKRGIRLLNVPTHVAQPYLKSRWSTFHNVFAHEMQRLTQKRFRHRGGYAVNFMYHHYLRSLGEGEFYFDPRHRYIDWSFGLERRHALRESLERQDPDVTRFCINDHPGDGTNSAAERSWAAYRSDILDLVDRQTKH